MNEAYSDTCSYIRGYHDGRFYHDSNNPIRVRSLCSVYGQRPGTIFDAIEDDVYYRVRLPGETSQTFSGGFYKSRFEVLSERKPFVLSTEEIGALKWLVNNATVPLMVNSVGVANLVALSKLHERLDGEGA